MAGRAFNVGTNPCVSSVLEKNLEGIGGKGEEGGGERAFNVGTDACIESNLQIGSGADASTQ